MNVPSADLHVLPPVGHRWRRFTLILLALAPFAFGALALFLGQDANWDLRNYHWYNAYAFIHGRYGTDVLPSQVPWFYNPTLDVPFYLLATHVPARVAGFVLGTVQGLNFVLLFMLAHAALIVPNQRQKVLLCALLAAIGMLGGGGIALIGTTFYDNVTSLGLFLSALIVVRYQPCIYGGSWRTACAYAVLAGIPAGVVVGLKLPCFTLCLGLCAGLLLSAPGWGRRWMVSAAFGVGVASGLAASLGHWAWGLESHFGSPLFPYFNDIFKAPLAPVSSARDMQYVPRSLHDVFLFPFIFADSAFRTGEIPFRDLGIPALYVLLPAALAARLVFGRSKSPEHSVAVPSAARYLLWVAVVAYFSWLIMFGIYRYAVPLEMLAPLLIVFAVNYLPVKPPQRAMLTAFILLIVAVTVQPGNWGRRSVWLDHFMEVDVPELGPVADTMVLMAGIEPYSHIVTKLPPEMPVVRIQSNFSDPEQGQPFNRIIRERLNRHKGRFLILIPTWQHEVAGKALAHFRLVADWKACQTVRDHLFESGSLYDLCPVTREK